MHMKFQISHGFYIAALKIETFCSTSNKSSANWLLFYGIECDIHSSPNFFKPHLIAILLMNWQISRATANNHAN